jgi:hypothetical protein
MNKNNLRPLATITKEQRRNKFLKEHPKLAKAIKKQEDKNNQIQQQIIKKHLDRIKKSNNMKTLYQKGLTIYQIAKRFKTTYQQTHYLVHRTSNTFYRKNLIPLHHKNNTHERISILKQKKKAIT